MSRIAQAARAPQRTYLASGAASWVDDFLSWLSPSLPKCCRAHAGAATSTAAAQGGGLRIRSYNRPWLVYDGLENDRDGSSNAGGYCPPPDQPPCSGNATACADCNVCLMELPGVGSVMP